MISAIIYLYNSCSLLYSPQWGIVKYHEKYLHVLRTGRARKNQEREIQNGGGDGIEVEIELPSGTTVLLSDSAN